MSQFINNVNIDVAEISKEITFNWGSGVSTETDIYLNLDHVPDKMHISNDKAFVVAAINGTDLTNPRTVSAGTGFGFVTSNFQSVISVKIRTSDTNSHFEVMMW